MIEVDIEMLKEHGLKLVDTAKKTAQDLAEKGKGLADKGRVQLELVNQQARLTKAQRQLGALVYSLHKAGEENQPLVEKYIDAIAEVEKTIEDLKASMAATEVDEEAAAEEPEAADEAPAEDEAVDETEEVIEEEPILPRGETKTCPVCGAKVDADALFCNHCGAQL